MKKSKTYKKEEEFPYDKNRRFNNKLNGLQYNKIWHVQIKKFDLLISAIKILK